MIRDLSQTLAALLSTADLPEEVREAQVSFEHPIDTFNPSQPTVNLFLYELRENRELRTNAPIVRRQRRVRVQTMSETAVRSRYGPSFA